jgi:uncharacterized protein (TIGR02001 family)
MRNLRIVAALGLFAAAGAANAGVTATVTAVSDYDFRGITQSAQDPALQASVDYAHDSGWYIGEWASNVDFGDGSDIDKELDLYTGFSGSTGEGGLAWDAGLIYYTYPDDSDANYFEIYGSLAKDWFKGKLWYSNDFGGDLTDGDTPAWYIEGNGTFPIGESGFSVLVHAGYSFGDYWDDLKDVGIGDKYFDFSVGAGYTYKNFNFALKYVDGSDLKELDDTVLTPDDVFSTEPRIILSVATTFPWK